MVPFMRVCLHMHTLCTVYSTSQLAAAVGATRVYCYGEVTAEERGVEQAVARALDAQGAALKVGVQLSRHMMCPRVDPAGQLLVLVSYCTSIGACIAAL